MKMLVLSVITVLGLPTASLVCVQYAQAEPRINGIRNAASAEDAAVQSLAPGEVITILGSGLGPNESVAADVGGPVVSTALAATRVIINNVSAPLLSVQESQLRVVVPFEVAREATATVEVEYQGVRSSPATSKQLYPVQRAAPGLFTVDANGAGQAEALNQDDSSNSPAQPAATGSVLRLYATGGGILSPAASTGEVSMTKAENVLPVTATIAGVPARVLYAGSAIGRVAGILQVDIQIPVDAPPGPAVPVQLIFGPLRFENGGIIVIESFQTQTQAGVTIAIERGSFSLPGSYTVSTISGGSPGFSGDAGSALTAQFSRPVGLAVDGAGNLYVADAWNRRVRRIDASGTINTVIGNGRSALGCSSVVDQPATSVSLGEPVALTAGPSGTLYVGDTSGFDSFICGGQVFRTDGNGRITRIQSGLQVAYGSTFALAVSDDGTLYASEPEANRVTSVAPGTATRQVLPVSVQLSSPHGLAVDSDRNLYIADTGNHRIVRVTPAGAISVAAEGPLQWPVALAVGPGNTLYIADEFACQLFRLTSDGQIRAIAGTGNFGGLGDGGPALEASFDHPSAVAIDIAGNIYIADTGNNRIRKMTPAQ